MFAFKTIRAHWNCRDSRVGRILALHVTNPGSVLRIPHGLLSPPGVILNAEPRKHHQLQFQNKTKQNKLVFKCIPKLGPKGMLLCACVLSRLGPKGVWMCVWEGRQELCSLPVAHGGAFVLEVPLMWSLFLEGRAQVLLALASPPFLHLTDACEW